MLLVSLAAPAAAHSWYSDLRDPEGRACCAEQDCRPVAMCRTGDGRPGLRIDPDCVAIPWSRVLATPSPDDRAHACWVRILLVPQPIIHCVILPGEA